MLIPVGQVFSGDTDNGDVLVMPYIGMRFEVGPSETDAAKFAGGLNFSYGLMILAFILAFVFWVQARKPFYPSAQRLRQALERLVQGLAIMGCFMKGQGKAVEVKEAAVASTKIAPE